MNRHVERVFNADRKVPSLGRPEVDAGSIDAGADADLDAFGFDPGGTLPIVG